MKLPATSPPSPDSHRAAMQARQAAVLALNEWRRTLAAADASWPALGRAEAALAVIGGDWTDAGRAAVKASLEAA